MQPSTTPMGSNPNEIPLYIKVGPVYFFALSLACCCTCLIRSYFPNGFLSPIQDEMQNRIQAVAQIVFSRENPNNNNIPVNNSDQRIIFVNNANMSPQSREGFDNSSPRRSIDGESSPRSDNLSSPRSLREGGLGASEIV